MRFTGDLQFRFPRRGAAFELSPAFQRRERRRLDLPVAERRLSKNFQEQSEQMLRSHKESIRPLCQSTVAPRLWLTIARSPALKRRAKLKRRSAAGRQSVQKLVKSDRTVGRNFAILIFTLLSVRAFDSREVIALTRQGESSRQRTRGCRDNFRRK